MGEANIRTRRPTIGVMGSSSADLSESDASRLTLLAQRLGRAIAHRDCVLITGATTGFPDIVSRAARDAGCVTVGISPAASRTQHTTEFSLPDDGANVIVFTGFGLKGRNVVNVRSSDIVIIFGGGIGTLNEFTIAYDEGNVIGVLEGTGGVADQIREITKLSRKPKAAQVFLDPSPEDLIDSCLKILAARA